LSPGTEKDRCGKRWVDQPAKKKPNIVSHEMRQAKKKCEHFTEGITTTLKKKIENNNHGRIKKKKLRQGGS